MTPIRNSFFFLSKGRLGVENSVDYCYCVQVLDHRRLKIYHCIAARQDVNSSKDFTFNLLLKNDFIKPSTVR